MTDWGYEGRFNRDPLPVFSAGSPCEQLQHEHGCPLFDVDHNTLPLPTTASPTLQGAPKDGLGEIVVACDIPEPCKFSSLNSCQKRFLWTHKKVDLAQHPVICLVLQAGDTEKFPHALGFKGLDPSFRVSKQGPCFTAIGEDGGDMKRVELELACKADGVAPPYRCLVWPLLPLLREF